MDDLPYNVPILLRSHHGTDLHGLHGLDVVKCTTFGQGGETPSSAMFASVVLHRLDKFSVAIQLFRNKRFLAVDDSGDCRFAEASLSDLADKFKFHVEIRVIPDSMNHLFFVSRRTGKALVSDDTGDVRCDNDYQPEWEAWTIIELMVPTDSAPVATAVDAAKE